MALILTYVEQAVGQPYTCQTIIEVQTSPRANKIVRAVAKSASVDAAKIYIIGIIYTYVNSNPDIRPRLPDEREHVIKIVVPGKQEGEFYKLRIGVRRLGDDTGRDILINTSNLVRDTYRHMMEIRAKPKTMS